MKAENFTDIDKIEIGKKVRVQTKFSDKWIEGVITEIPGVLDKFVKLSTGEKVFVFEVKNIKNI